jgi:hypothetical protein
MNPSQTFKWKVGVLAAGGLLIAGNACEAEDRPSAAEYFAEINALEATFFPVFEREYRSAREYIDAFIAAAREYRVRADLVKPTTSAIVFERFPVRAKRTISANTIGTHLPRRFRAVRRRVGGPADLVEVWRHGTSRLATVGRMVL